MNRTFDRLDFGHVYLIIDRDNAHLTIDCHFNCFRTVFLFEKAVFKSVIISVTLTRLNKLLLPFYILQNQNKLLCSLYSSHSFSKFPTFSGFSPLQMIFFSPTCCLAASLSEKKIIMLFTARKVFKGKHYALVL